MKLTIRYGQEITTNDTTSYQLEELNRMIEKEMRVETKLSYKADPGGKSIGLLEAITIAKLIVDGIGMLIDVLKYWNGINKKHSIKIKKGNRIILMNNLSEDEILDILATGEQDSFEIIIN